MQQPIQFLKSKETSLSYMDVCPSELFYTDLGKEIVHIAVHYFVIKKHEVKVIPQFKNSRGIKNKLKWIDYIIDEINKENIGLACFAYKSKTDIAFKNGIDFLIKENIIEDKTYDYENESLTMFDENIKLKNIIALAWYAIFISIVSRKLSIIAKITHKDSYTLMLDLIPGDSKLRIYNIKIIEQFIFNSHLSQYFEEDLKDNHISKCGVAYGGDISESNKIKNIHEYAITDWIARSCYERYSTNSKNEEYKELGKLANYLQNKGLIELINTPKIGF